MNVQADLSVYWVHMFEGIFSKVVAHILIFQEDLKDFEIEEAKPSFSNATVWQDTLCGVS